MEKNYSRYIEQVKEKIKLDWIDSLKDTANPKFCIWIYENFIAKENEKDFIDCIDNWFYS